MKAWISPVLITTLLLAGCGAVATAPVATTAAASFEALKAKQPPAGQFTLGEYNVENLFDNSTVPADPKSAPPKPEAAKQALAASIRQLNADVIALVEVESQGTLRRFRDQYLQGMGYEQVVLREGNDQRGIDVGVLSRFPIKHIRTHKNAVINVPNSAPQKLSRDLLELEVSAGRGYDFTLFVTHLKAHAGGVPADAKRLAEAQWLRKTLRDFENEHPDRNYALCGDFNDGPATPTLKPLLESRERDAKLYDVLAEMGTTPTYVKPPYIGRIDFILLSEGMKKDYVSGSARVNDTPEARAASDHVPAAITIDGTQDR